MRYKISVVSNVFFSLVLIHGFIVSLILTQNMLFLLKNVL